jgi:hypothetical protein
MALTCLTNIKILTETTIAIKFKDILNDCNMSIALAVTRFNLIHDC